MNTRLSPTTNGHLHMGHVYMALVNEYVAHVSGGRFGVRLEDTQPQWQENNKEYAASMWDDLDWLGIETDWRSLQSQYDIRTLQFVVEHEHDPIFQPDIPDQFAAMPTRDITFYSYTPWFTCEKVIIDHMEGVDTLIRGEEIITEFSLYSYFVQLFDLPKVKHIYLPRLSCGVGDISKTLDNYTVRSFRDDGYHPAYLKERLAQTCLKDPSGPWLPSNILPHPCL
jgi:glutamyl/glutaminyl-tRNA synthetase